MRTFIFILSNIILSQLFGQNSMPGYSKVYLRDIFNKDTIPSSDSCLIKKIWFDASVDSIILDSNTSYIFCIADNLVIMEDPGTDYNGRKWISNICNDTLHLKIKNSDFYYLNVYEDKVRYSIRIPGYIKPFEKIGKVKIYGTLYYWIAYGETFIHGKYMINKKRGSIHPGIMAEEIIK
jgi:hypothetical protein